MPTPPARCHGDNVAVAVAVELTNADARSSVVAHEACVTPAAAYACCLRAMELDDTDRRTLRRDEGDLFAATMALGDTLDEFDVATGTHERRFARGEQWREALTAIRK